MKAFQYQWLTRMWLIVAVLLITGCSYKYHQEQTDKEVYDILKKIEKNVFKRESNFTIDSSTQQVNTLETTNQDLVKRSNTQGIMTLNIQECIDYAIINSNEYQSRKEDLYLSALSMNDAKVPYNLNKSSSVSATNSNESNGDQIGDIEASNSISTLLRGGGSLSIALANDLVKYFTGSSNESISSVLSFRLFQPLLRGSGSKVAAENLTQSYRNVIYELRDYAFFQEDFARDIVSNYFRILNLNEQVKNAEKNYQSRNENHEYLKARSIDRSSPSDVADAKQEALTAKIRVINAQSTLESALDNFKLTIGMPTGIELKLVEGELEKLSHLGIQPIGFDQTEIYQYALKHRHSLLNEIDRFEDGKRKVEIAADNLRTQLNFISTASISNSGDRWERLNFNDISTSIGLELDLPINRKTQRNSYRRSLISLDSQVRSLSQTHDRLKNLINLRLRELEQQKQNYEIQVGALNLAENRVEGNRLRLKAGTLVFRRLSESQDSLINAQNAVIAALISYQDARLNLYSEIGALDASKSNFWLLEKPIK